MLAEQGRRSERVEWDGVVERLYSSLDTVQKEIHFLQSGDSCVCACVRVRVRVRVRACVRVRVRVCVCACVRV